MHPRNAFALLVVVCLFVTLVPWSRPQAQAQTDPPIMPIGSVQGAATSNCRALRSPFASVPPAPANTPGTTLVRVQGVITQRTRQRTGASGSLFGFFIQNTATTADTDPNTSDGIFVFTSTFQTMLRLGGGTYTPQIGDEVVVRGRVSEFFNLTQIVNAPFGQPQALHLESVIRTGVNLEVELPAFDAAPPANFPDADCYWERREGMRGRVPVGSIVTGRRQVFASNSDAEVWVIRPDDPVAQRTNPFTRRVYRDPHPLDNVPGQLFDDGNGYRILLGSHGIKFAAGSPFALIAPARTYDTLTASTVGGVSFGFSKYIIMPNVQITLAAGSDPSTNGGVPAHDRIFQYSVATFNVENLYDFRDDPFDGCDFAGNAGCPGVNPPFDYVPASNAAYQQRVQQLASQIVTDLGAPDIIMVQEAEDQDICVVSAATLVCGSTNNADGKPDTLQELALAIKALDGVDYDAAFDRHGADDRGIISPFMFRTDRVELLPADASHPVLGSSPTVSYRVPGHPYNTDVQNPKVLNAPLPGDVDLSTGVDGSDVFTRAPQVGLFRVWRDHIGRSAFTDLYLLNNHFSSGPNTRVGQRKEQALYNAAIVDALQKADPDLWAIVGGDLNVFPRPDDPFSPGQALFPSDQLSALYGQGLTNLWDRLIASSPVAAYSYVFEGQAQTLDQFFATPTLLRDLRGIHAAHVNSDWPVEHEDGPRGLSDHDPQVSRYRGITLKAVARLVHYYGTTGAIRGNNTARNLAGHLERAARFRAAGQQDAAEAQIQAFRDQLQDFVPGSISQATANVLLSELNLLLQLPDWH